MGDEPGRGAFGQRLPKRLAGREVSDDELSDEAHGEVEADLTRDQLGVGPLRARMAREQ